LSKVGKGEIINKLFIYFSLLACLFKITSLHLSHERHGAIKEGTKRHAAKQTAIGQDVGY
jgi:hypothetical protein